MQLAIKTQPHISSNISVMEQNAVCVNISLSQFGAKAGVKKFGDAAVQAIMQVCNQLDYKDALHLVHKKETIGDKL